MARKKPHVLLIGSKLGYWALGSRLEKHGCECWFVSSYQAARSLLDRENFDLVLSPMRMSHESLYRLVGLLEGSDTTLCYSQAVESGCWWLLALRHGKNCFGSKALRAGEFAKVLDKAIAELRSNPRAPAESRPATALPSASTMKTLPSAGTARPRAVPVGAPVATVTTYEAVG
jgi:DNA-binding NtrC family response regulator